MSIHNFFAMQTTVQVKWPKPEYKTSGAVWFDFASVSEVTVLPKSLALIDTWVVIKVQPWTFLQIMPRSSTFKNFGLILVNGVGIIDQDYCWPTDTVKFAYYNLWDLPVTIPVRTRIWQWVILPVYRADFVDYVDGDATDRWGFGTTGNG